MFPSKNHFTNFIKSFFLLLIINKYATIVGYGVMGETTCLGVSGVLELALIA